MPEELNNLLNEPEENYKTGYIKLYRSIKDHWVYGKNRPRTEFEAWIYLVLTASHKGAKEPVGYSLIKVERGQILTSQDKLSKAWRWDRNKVRRFLEMLKKDKMIVSKSDQKATMITICNYDSYQGCLPTSDQQVNTYKNVKNVKKENIYAEFFDFFTKISGKKIRILDDKTKGQINARMKEGFTMEDFKTAIENCKKDQYHIDNPKYLTPEFITRSDKLQKFLTQTIETPEQNQKNETAEKNKKVFFHDGWYKYKNLQDRSFESFARDVYQNYNLDLYREIYEPATVY